MTKTYLIDIDGTLLEHIPDFKDICSHTSLRALPGAREKTSQWHCEGHVIIIITARPEGLRKLTELQLFNAGIIYDSLIMGVGAGPRILINDHLEGTENKAVAVNVIRNVDGIINVNS